MKLKSLLLIITTMILSVLLIGCAQHVNTIDNQPIPSSSLSKDQIGDSIIEAGRVRGWIISKSDTPDQLVGKLLYNGKTVTVNIPYSEKGYSIDYVSSTGLNYNKADNKISRSYNNWINYLNTDIQRQLLIQDATIKNAK